MLIQYITSFIRLVKKRKCSHEDRVIPVKPISNNLIGRWRQLRGFSIGSGKVVRAPRASIEDDTKVQRGGMRNINTATHTTSNHGFMQMRTTKHFVIESFTNAENNLVTENPVRWDALKFTISQISPNPSKMSQVSVLSLRALNNRVRRREAGSTGNLCYNTSGSPYTSPGLEDFKSCTMLDILLNWLNRIVIRNVVIISIWCFCETIFLFLMQTTWKWHQRILKIIPTSNSTNSDDFNYWFQYGKGKTLESLSRCVCLVTQPPTNPTWKWIAAAWLKFQFSTYELAIDSHDQPYCNWVKRSKSFAEENGALERSRKIPSCV